jgi:hypothetical protein
LRTSLLKKSAIRTRVIEEVGDQDQAALDLGDPRDDAALADLQQEARKQLPLADLTRRVVVTAVAPGARPTG